MAASKWVDLLDPTEEELRAAAPHELETPALELLLSAPAHNDEPRPTLWSHGDYIFGIFLVAVAIPEEDTIYYQQVGIVLTNDMVLTVRKTPPGGRPPYDPSDIREEMEHNAPCGIVVYRIIDDVAERYLDLVDDIDAEIDELEDKIETQSAERTRARISELRHDMLRVRRALAPMRDAVRRVVVNAVEVTEGPIIFPPEVEVLFSAAYDKLMRALDGLELSRDLLASVRDYHQSKIANDQNEVMKRLTVIASLILVPTFIVGLYGQNFVDVPELHWHYGYAYSWGSILVITVIQLFWFRRKGWL